MSNSFTERTGEPLSLKRAKELITGASTIFREDQNYDGIKRRVTDTVEDTRALLEQAVETLRTQHEKARETCGEETFFDDGPFDLSEDYSISERAIKENNDQIHRLLDPAYKPPFLRTIIRKCGKIMKG